ncbi:zinc-binding protein A33-like [Chiloscyllium punctatum]|uniref:zinc-binding protein A33-like n=1 Tax=Chiloscyllium punctatum TaxID=137246 RepID=UPI003B6425B3
MNMDSRQQFQSFIEDLICPICQDFFTKPVALNCEHNFCHTCITQSWKNKINSCPLCREEFRERNLRVNCVLANLAEKARKFNQNPQEMARKHHCEEHQEALKLFCETDKKLICVNCVDSQEHREHHFISIKEAVGIYKEKVKCSLTEKEAAVRETEQKRKQKISEIREKGSDLQSHITSSFAKMHQFLTEKEQRLIQDLREQEEKIVEPIEKNLLEIQEKLNFIQKKLSKLQEQMEYEDEILFLKDETSRTRRISDDYNKLPLADSTLSDENFNSFFQYTVWREIIDAIKPVPASLTLDPDTAHPDVIVNEDRTSVRLRDSDSFHFRSLYKLERFDPSFCVRGSEGFTSGRHYWEVEVGDGKEWALGVTRESAERKRVSIPSPETGFWCLYRDRLGRYLVSTFPSPTPLPPSERPQKIGVFLDYEGGQMSFYDADDVSHLYTFTQTFTERIVPIFRPGLDKKPLRICRIKSH